MDLIQTLIISTLASIIPGQILRFGAGEQGAITLTDIFVALTVILFILHSLLIEKTIKVPQKIFFPIILFTLAAASSLYLSQTTFSLKEVAISSFFLIRFLLYFLITIVVLNTVKKKQTPNWVNSFLIIGFIFAFIGFVQLIIFPDLSQLVSYGWDPHQKRIAASLLDPNYSGMIFTFLIAFSTSLYLYKKNKIYLFYSAFIFIALILTFSRSSYLACIFTVITIGLLKSARLIAASFILFLIFFFTIPQMRERIIGAFTFDETSQARIESWQNAIKIFSDHPFFGVGFNTYRYAQAKYGFFPPGELGGHSGSGTDSSILLIFATSGIFGAAFYLMFIAAAVITFAKGAKKSYLKLASLSSFIGLLVHSQFVNSLFFPQIMVILWFILGLNLVDDN